MKKSFLFGAIALVVYGQNLVMPVWDYDANGGKGAYVWLKIDPATLEVVNKTLRVKAPAPPVPTQGMIAWHVPEDLTGTELAPIVQWPNRANTGSPAAARGPEYVCQTRTNVIGSFRGVQCGAAPTACGPNCGFLVMPISYDIAQSTWIFVLRHNSPLAGSQNALLNNGQNNVTFGASVGPGGSGGQMQRYSWYANQNGSQYGNGFGITTSAAPQIVGFSAGANGPWFYQNGAQRRPWNDAAGLEDSNNVWQSQPASYVNKDVYLGGNTCNGCTWPGVIVEVMAWNRQLSRDEADAVQQYLLSKYPSIGRGQVNVVQYGDSIELGQGSTWGAPQAEAKYVGRMAGAVPSVFSFAYSGRQWITQESKTYPKYFIGSAYDPISPGMFDPHASKNVVTWKFGANDLWSGFQSAAAMKTAVNAMVADFKAHGWDKVYVGTIIPRYVGQGYVAGEAQAKLFNAWLLDPNGGFAGDGVIDYTSIPCFSWGDASSNHVVQITKNLADDGVTPVLDPTGAGGCYATGDQTHPSDYGHAARALLEYNFYRSRGIQGFTN